MKLRDILAKDELALLRKSLAAINKAYRAEEPTGAMHGMALDHNRNASEYKPERDYDSGALAELADFLADRRNPHKGKVSHIVRRLDGIVEEMTGRARERKSKFDAWMDGEDIPPPF